MSLARFPLPVLLFLIVCSAVISAGVRRWDGGERVALPQNAALSPPPVEKRTCDPCAALPSPAPALSLALLSQAGSAASITHCGAAAAAGSAWAALLDSGAALPPRAAPHARALGAGPHYNTRFDVLPVAFEAPNMERFGGGPESDGSKLIRAPVALGPGVDRCIVYSFGGNAQVEFEADVIAREPACHVWQFDCTVDVSTMDAISRAGTAAFRERFTFLRAVTQYSSPFMPSWWRLVTAANSLRLDEPRESPSSSSACAPEKCVSAMRSRARNTVVDECP